MDAAASDDFATQQREVQRLLGRCFLRLQQYELLLKALLQAQQVSTDAGDRLAERAERLRVSPLGMLAKELFDAYVLPAGASDATTDADARPPSDKLTIRTRMTIEMSDERLAATKAAIKDLVTMRNDLAHHLLERFDLWSVDGCEAARSYLGTCYEQIDQRFVELKEWATHADEARREFASFMLSEAAQDFIVDGIAPDGSVHWGTAGIVRALREAAAANSHDGWTSLPIAVSWLATHHPTQQPGRYGCKTWPQVLHLSGLFRLEYRRADDGRKVGWFQEHQQRRAR